LQRLFEARGIDPIAIERLNEYWVQKLEENQEQIAALSDTENPQNQNPDENNPDQQSTGQQQDLSPSQLDLLLDFPSLDDANVVLGLNASDLDRLRDVVTALPKRHYPWINANTAPREVLDAITGDGSISESIITQRLETPLQLADWTQAVGGLDTQDPEFARVRQMARVTSRVYRVMASALVNPDPTTGLGGIGRTASMLVRRVPAPVRRSDSNTAGRWTLTRLDWQKEGGARLFLADHGLVPGAGEDELRFF
jgi:hypothetical protein